MVSFHCRSVWQWCLLYWLLYRVRSYRPVGAVPVGMNRVAFVLVLRTLCVPGLRERERERETANSPIPSISHNTLTTYNINPSPHILQYMNVKKCEARVRTTGGGEETEGFSTVSLSEMSAKVYNWLNINPLNKKRRPVYLKTQFVMRSKQFSSRL
jgi:hypothetical protein